ncbi:MAG: protein-disulfide reductase DsbD domain-containing protein [Terracidiphilus sp.]
MRTTKALKKHYRIATMLAVALAAIAAHGQNLIANQPEHSLPGVAPVQYLFPEQVTLTANKPATVALHFRVANGLHINSHTPHDDYLIPTVFSIPANSGARLESANYPSGADITLPLDPKTRLSVYTGDFIIEARIVAMRGNYLVQARLHYQACNMSQCLPPRTITATFDVIAK